MTHCFICGHDVASSLLLSLLWVGEGDEEDVEETVSEDESDLLESVFEAGELDEEAIAESAVCKLSVTAGSVLSAT